LLFNAKGLISRLFRFARLKLIDFLISCINFLFANKYELKIRLNPKMNDLKVSSTYNSKVSNWAIVIQGPVIENSQSEYLGSTLAILRNFYPSAKIVLSSYDYCEKPIRQIPEHLYDSLILSSDFELKSNFERQVYSTYVGGKEAMRFKPDFILKLRTDQRLTSVSSLDYIEIMLNRFPTQNNDSGFRIFGSSYNTWKYRVLGISDMLIAANSKDFLEYWKFDQAIIDFSLETVPNGNSASWISKHSFFYESFLAAKFLINQGYHFSDSPILDTTLMWKHHMGVLDSNELGHEWNKRKKYWIGNSFIKTCYNLPIKSSQELSFSEWLAIVSGKYVIDEDLEAFKH
jgi:hypothetical protein